MMYKRLGPVRVRCSKYPLFVTIIIQRKARPD